MVAPLACKKCNVRRSALHLFAFFQAGARGNFSMFFCLDAKEPKNQGCEKIGLKITGKPKAVKLAR